MATPDPSTIRLGDLSIHRSRFEVRRGQGQILLTRKEMGVLWILASQSGKTFRRGELVRGAWGQNVFVTPRTVDVHIAKLRKKLGFLCGESLRIETVWGVGYRLRYPD